MEFERKCEITRAIASYVLRTKGRSCTMREVVECQKEIPAMLPVLSRETGISARELMEKWFEDHFIPSGTLQ